MDRKPAMTPSEAIVAQLQTKWLGNDNVNELWRGWVERIAHGLPADLPRQSFEGLLSERDRQAEGALLIMTNLLDQINLLEREVEKLRQGMFGGPIRLVVKSGGNGLPPSTKTLRVGEKIA